MPYFVFKMTTQEGMSIFKNLELLKEFEAYKEAKKYARDARTANEDKQVTIKMYFADNQLKAEEELLEHRDKPIVMEHEK